MCHKAIEGVIAETERNTEAICLEDRRTGELLLIPQQVLYIDLLVSKWYIMANNIKYQKSGGT